MTKSLYEAEYQAVGNKRFCHVCKKEIIDFTKVHPCLEEKLDNLQWAKEFMERYERKHGKVSKT